MLPPPLPDFLLAIYVRPVDPTSEPMPAPRLVRCAELIDAVRELMLYPMDMFHPSAARQAHLDQYIHKAEVIDLRRGEIALSTFCPYKDLQAGKTAVMLILDRSYPMEMLSPTLAQTKKPRHGLDAFFHWLGQSDDGAGLMPMKSYIALSEEALFQRLPDGKTISYGKYAVCADAVRLGAANVVGEELQFNMMLKYEFFQTRDQALAHMLKIPADYYNEATAISNDLSFFIRHIQLQKNEPKIDPLALISMAKVKDTRAAKAEGRYLAVLPLGVEYFSTLGYSTIDNFGRLERMIIELDKLDPKDGITLRSTGVAQEIIAELEKKRIDLSMESEYVVEMVRKMSIDESQRRKGYAEVADLHLFVHTDDLRHAIFEMSSHSMRDYQLKPDKDGKIPYHTTEACIKNKTGDIIFRIDIPAGEVPTDIYLRVHNSYMDHPSFTQLSPAVLGMGNMKLSEDRDGYTVFQIGVASKQGIVETPGFLKFGFLQKAQVLTSYVEENRTLQAKVAAEQSNLSNFKVELLWSMQNATDPPKVFETQVIFPTAARAKQWIDQLFKASKYPTIEMGSKDRHLTLQWALLLDQKRKLGVREVRLNADHPATLQIIQDKKMRSPQLADLMDAFTQYLQTGKDNPNDPSAYKSRVFTFIPETKPNHRPGH